MKIECNEVPPVKTYTLTLSQREINLLATAANMRDEDFYDSSTARNEGFGSDDYSEFCNLIVDVLDQVR